ncbi:MAG: hypothetical protein KKB45_18385, partial [Gammaproteobacteria bacterium]|nr:hypothetical protein [Gammaproteobacteria bacterium]
VKHFNLYSIFAFVLVALVYTKFAVAMPMATQPSTLHSSPSLTVHLGDDTHDDPDGEPDQCDMMFPFCEAHLD